MTQKPIAVLASTIKRGVHCLRERYGEDFGGFHYCASGAQLRRSDRDRALVAFIATNEDHLRGREISGFWVADWDVPIQLVQIAETRVRAQ